MFFSLSHPIPNDAVPLVPSIDYVIMPMSFISDEDEKTDVNNPKKKVSPAEYRRIHPLVPMLAPISRKPLSNSQSILSGKIYFTMRHRQE